MNKKSEISKAAVTKRVKSIRCKTPQTCSDEENIGIVLADLCGEESIWYSGLFVAYGFAPLCRNTQWMRSRQKESTSRAL